MGVTIKDVAKIANVNPSTVSRVIANSSRISEKTKKNVREAMKQLGYYPNHHARSLANQSAQTIGIVMPSSNGDVFQNPFFPQIIRGISKEAHAKRYGLYITTGITKEEIHEEILSMVQGRRVDGLIILYSRVDDELVDLLLGMKFPFVIVGKPYHLSEAIPHVDNNNVKAASEATRLLLDLGHTKCAFIGGAVELVVTADRQEGYSKTLIEAGVPIRKEYMVHKDFLEEGGREAIKELFSIEDPPTGLIVSDDLMALGVISYLSELGVQVPQDVSIISFNNTQICDYCTPALTSIDINIFELGCQATIALFNQIHQIHTATTRYIVPHKIVQRQSSGPFRLVDS